MSPTKSKRRTSILKKRINEEDEPTENTVTKIAKKTHFSSKNQVKEFAECEERFTIWGNTYETSVSNTKSSSDGSAASNESSALQKTGINFTNTTMYNSTSKLIQECEKENVHFLEVPKQENAFEIRESISNNSMNISSARNSVEHTLEMNSSELKRVKKYPVNGLDITNMALDTSLLNKNLLNPPTIENKKVLSPRKMIFHNSISKVRVAIQDKVLLSPSELEDNISITMEQDERDSRRRTDYQVIDMNVTQQKKKPVMTFKPPEVPKVFSFSSKIYTSPPAKCNDEEKEDIDELFKMIVSDTPSKLCCLGKTHTPTRSESKKVIYSVQKPTTSIRRNSMDLFREIGLIDSDSDEKFKPCKSIIHNDSIENKSDERRKTSYEKDMEKSLEENSHQKSVFHNMSIEEKPKQRQTIFEPENIDIDERRKTFTMKSAAESKILHNITNTDLLNIIDDESNPCSNTIDSLNSMQHLSTKNKSLRESTISSPVKNYDKMLEKSNERRKTSYEKDMEQSIVEMLHHNSIFHNMSIEEKPKQRETVFEPENIETETNRQKFINDSMRWHNASVKENSTRNTIVQKESNERRKTSYENDMEQSLEENPHQKSVFHNMSIEEKPKQRQTVFEPENIETDTNRQKFTNDSMKSHNASVKENSIRKTIVQKESNEKRKTSYENYMKQSLVENLHQNSIFHNMSIEENSKTIQRQTVFEPQLIDTDDRRKTFTAEESKILHNIIDNESNLYGNTIDSSNSMQFTIMASPLNDTIAIQHLSKKNKSLRESTISSPVKNYDNILGRRKTSYENDMEQSLAENLHQKSVFHNMSIEEKPKQRQTVFEPENIETDTNRQTFTNNSMRSHNASVKENSIRNTIVQKESNERRKTSYENDMEQSLEENPHQKSVFHNMSIEEKPKQRQTVFEPENIETDTNRPKFTNNSMRWHNISAKENTTRSIIIQKESNEKRKTSYENYMEQSIVENLHQNSIFHNMSIEEKPKKRQTVFEPENIETDTNRQKFTNESMKSHNASVKENSIRKTIVQKESNEIRKTSYENYMEQSIAENLHQNSIFNNMSIEENSKTIQRQTVFEPQLIDTDERRKTFTMKSAEESKIWHNITDTDLFNMIDDESNPCGNTIDSSNSMQLSNEPSIYENAIEDFVNLTIMPSPLNDTTATQRLSKKNKSRRESRIPSPVKNYDNMLDNLMDNLRKKDKPKPRLEIDDYLEKMNVNTVKLKGCVQSNYLIEKINEKFEVDQNKREKRRIEKQHLEAIHPHKPSAKFLMKNLIECMDEEIIKNIKQNQNAISPVFPESIDFELLMNNKFETDESLSKYWDFNSLYWWNKNLKLMHWKMPMFTLNFNCLQSSTEANESTIPIMFKDVFLYITEEYRIKANETKKNLLMRKEFKRALNGVSNFTSMCNSTKELFSFLDYYHDNVMKTVDLVANFFNIISKYGAIYINHPDFSYPIIKKMVLLQHGDETDVVNLRISLDGCIEMVSLKDLSIDGKFYSYVLQPKTNLIEHKGLMFIELVLFNTEKFLETNSHRIKHER